MKIAQSFKKRSIVSSFWHEFAARYLLLLFINAMQSVGFVMYVFLELNWFTVFALLLVFQWRWMFKSFFFEDVLGCSTQAHRYCFLFVLFFHEIISISISFYFIWFKSEHMLEMLIPLQWISISLNQISFRFVTIKIHFFFNLKEKHHFRNLLLLECTECITKSLDKIRWSSLLEISEI